MTTPGRFASVRTRMQSFIASAIQFKAGPDQEANLHRATELVRAAADEGAALVALPELFAWGGPAADEQAHAESIPGPTTTFLSDLAARLSIHLAAGSILEAVGDGQHCYNTAVLFAPSGELLAVYRKIHLFDVNVRGGVAACESETRFPGEEVVCVSTELGRVGLAICYDLRFPELFRYLAAERAEIIIVPAAFTALTGRAHWHPLTRARAIENQCYVIAPNQFGPSSHGFDNYGHSLIVDPWGAVLAEAGERGQETIHASLDGERLAEVRRSLPSLDHRRLS